MGAISNCQQYKSTWNQFWPFSLSIMDDFDKINPLSAEDRKLLSDLTSTFDLGTQTIIGKQEDVFIDDISYLMSEVNEDWINYIKPMFRTHKFKYILRNI